MFFSEIIFIILDQVKDKNCSISEQKRIIESVKKSNNIKLAICSSINSFDIQINIIEILLFFNC